MNHRKVIFIMTDSQRADMVGGYGNPDMKTPNLDRLAEEGIRFDSAYTTQPAGLIVWDYPIMCRTLEED
ncbi:sulfatase-like hydrolase/transferase [Hungatella hathewayi]|uniref:sulfatase-like hydrolase/transferase n=1 Tax=Hungatella hathewayi TaxID=154046 RepID=UPI00356750AE